MYKVELKRVMKLTYISHGNKLITAIHSTRFLGLIIIMEKSYWPINVWIN